MSRAISLFELATELVRRHEQAAPGNVTVVPVLVDDLDVATPVLAAVTAVLEGRMFDVRHRDLQDPVPATTDVVRLAAVSGALRAGPQESARAVELIPIAGGLIDARFVNPPVGAEPSPGEETVLALARAAAHADLDAQAFGLIAYRASPIDFPFRRAAWMLAVSHLANLPSPALRTLVVVAEGDIDIALHCQMDYGFQLALSDDRLLRRRRADDLRVTAAELAAWSQPFVVFLGAGFSASSRIPLGNDLRDTAIRRLLDLGDELHTSDELARRFHAWIAGRPGWMTVSEAEKRADDYARELTLEQVIRAERRLYPALPTLQEFREHHDTMLERPGNAVSAFSSIVEATQGQIIIVEVNFDRLVESSSQIPLVSFYSDATFENSADYIRSYLSGAESAVPLLKLHGDINDLETCVVSDEQTELGVGAGKLHALRALLNVPELLWIYVGASMRDRDVVRVLQGEDFATGLDERWVAPYLVNSVEAFGATREPYWRTTPRASVDDRLVAETADAFMAAWSAALESRG